jgi:2-dehydropantoate 2-reductase
MFLTTKAYDIKKALLEYEALLKDTEWLVILQNGIGNEVLVEKYIPKEKIIRLLTSNGALLYAPGKVKHTGSGYTKIGFPFIKKGEKSAKSNESFKNLNLLKELLTNSGFKTTLSDDIIRDSWEKVFVNIGINPFGALTRLRNGQLLENKKIKALMGDAVEEAVKIARLKHINLSEQDFKALTYDVAKKTAENKNSMLQDVLKGKKTEIDFMNKKIMKYADELGVEVPINRTLSYLVKALELS